MGANMPRVPMDAIAILAPWQHQFASLGAFPEGTRMDTYAWYRFFVAHLQHPTLYIRTLV